VHALAEAGERCAIDDVSIVSEELAGALPLPAAGRGAVNQDEGVFLGGWRRADSRSQDNEADQQSEEADGFSW
jgi:hypothetical protein